MRRMGRPRALTRGEKTDGAATISRDAAPPPWRLYCYFTTILPRYCRDLQEYKRRRKAQHLTKYSWTVAFDGFTRNHVDSVGL